MTHPETRVAVVVARPERFGPIVARWFEGQLAGRAAHDVLDLAELPIPSPHFSEAIDRADAVVVVTPDSRDRGLPIAWNSFDDEGNLRDPAAAEAAAQRFIDQLVWWATTLRAGRRAMACAG